MLIAIIDFIMIRYIILKKSAVVFLLLVVFFGGIENAAGVGAKTGGIRWLSFQKAMKKNKNFKKPFFVWFHETGCEYCILFEKNILSEREVINLINENFYPVEINAYGGRKYEFFDGKKYGGKSLSSKFNVIGFPTSIFFDSHYKKIFYLPGYWNKKDFMLVLGWISSKSYKRESLRKYFKNSF